MMKLLFFGVLLSSALNVVMSDSCTILQSEDFERKVQCYYNTSFISFKGMKNEYVDVSCDGETYTCNDIKRFNFASNLSLPELSMTHCPPFLLQCINDIVYATTSQKVFLQQQTAALTKEDVVNLGNITELYMLRADKQTSLPLDTISALPTLRSLRLNGARSVQLPSEGWGTAPPLTYLELSEDELTEMPPGGFRGLGSLETLSVWGNSIERIEDGAFEGLSSLRTLSFSKNKLSSMSAGALSSLQQLRTLMITSNQLKELPDGVLAPLTKLIELQLNYNKIEQLSSSVFEGLSEVVRLDLSDNQLQELTLYVFAPLKKLQYLNLNYNQITSLPEDLFVGLAVLKEVYLDHNNIVHIHSKAFLAPTSLLTLSLAHNKLALELSPFEPLTDLKILNLAWNKISEIEYFRWSLNSLEHLNLSYNHFTGIKFDSDPDAPFMLNNATVDLRHNQIRRIYMTVLPKPESKSPQLLLDNNPFVCDCYMYIPRLKYDEDTKKGLNPLINFGNAYCILPQSLNNTSIAHVDLRDFICDISLDDDNCTASARPGSNELLLHCPVLPEILPDMTDKKILKYFTKKPTINLKLDSQPQTLGDLDIHALNLSNLNLETLEFKPTKYLKVLDVSFNNITKIPMEFLNANIEIKILNNSLDCSCSQYNAIKAIKNSKHVYGATCFDGQDVINMDLDTLCITENAIYIGVGTFIIAAIIVIAARSLIYKHYQKILIVMINKRVFKDFVKEIVLDKDKTYDFFVSYCETDLEIVENILVGKLENDFKQKVCVHKRDWNIGHPIPSQIQKSVEQSRRTIIYLSNNFLESYWGNMEFCAAHGLAEKEQRVRLILIIAEESVLANKDLSEELKAYIDTNTYVMFTDPNFDNKLEKILPQKHYAINWSFFCCRSNGNESVEENETPETLGLNVQLNNEGQLENVVRKDEGGKLENYV